jgi:hypothetical protein
MEKKKKKSSIRIFSETKSAEKNGMKFVSYIAWQEISIRFD